MSSELSRFRLALLLIPAGLLALLAPAVPALTRFAALPSRPQGPVTVLLAGVTPEYNEAAPVWPWPAKPENFTGITDTIVLAQLRPGGGVQLLSIPRDTWMNIPGYGWGKINGANPHGGSSMLVGAVQQLTGVRVDAYALLSLNALRDLTDAAGGVTVDVSKDLKYDDAAGKLHIDLKAGVQRLNGSQAEGFLRFRHDAEGDIGRVRRQQQFLSALAARVRSPLNLWRLPSVVGALDRNSRTDLTRAEVGQLLGGLASGLNVSTHLLPGNYGAGGTWAVDRDGVRALVRSSFSDPGDPRGQAVTLVNVDAPDGAARRLLARLLDAGYTDVSIVSEDRHTQARTRVAGSGAAAARLLADLGYGEPGGAATAGADLTVRLGADSK